MKIRKGEIYQVEVRLTGGWKSLKHDKVLKCYVTTKNADEGGIYSYYVAEDVANKYKEENPKQVADIRIRDISNEQFFKNKIK